MFTFIEYFTKENPWIDQFNSNIEKIYMKFSIKSFNDGSTGWSMGSVDSLGFPMALVDAINNCQNVDR